MSTRRQYRHVKYTYGKEKFHTKKEIRSRVAKILWVKSVPYQVTNTADLDFLLALFQCHPNWKTKQGPGITKIYVDKNPVYTHTRNFFLERIDQSLMDISYRKCISPPSRITKFSHACRNAVQNDIHSFKLANQQQFLCQICNRYIRRGARREVDHSTPTFYILVKDFIRERHIDVDTVTLSTDDATKLQFKNRFAGKSLYLAEQFLDYHRKRAKLRITHVRCNRKRSRE